MKTTFTYDHYYDYEELTNCLKQLCETYPDLMKMESICESEEGKQVWAVTIAKGDDTKKPAFYMDGKEVATSDAGDVYYTTSEEAIEADDYGVSPGNETVYTFANVDSTKAHNFTAVLRKTGTTIGAGSFSFTTAPDSLEPPVIVPQV